MTKFRSINMLSISALIPLFSAFIFPFMKHEIREFFYRETLFWIWGLPFDPYYFNGGTLAITLAVITVPCMLMSIGMLVEIALLFKSYIVLLKDNARIGAVSSNWIQRGREIIYLELMWNFWLLLLYFIFPFGIYYIEPPIFLPLVGGVILIIAGNLSQRFDASEETVLNRGSSLKFMISLYVFALVFYCIFFLIYFAFFIFPPFTYLEYVHYYRLLFGLHYFTPVLLIFLILKFGRFLDNVKINNLHEHKRLNTLYITTLVVIGILMLIYFLLNLILPIYAELFWWD